MGSRGSGAHATRGRPPAPTTKPPWWTVRSQIDPSIDAKLRSSQLPKATSLGLSTYHTQCRPLRPPAVQTRPKPSFESLPQKTITGHLRAHDRGLLRMRDGFCSHP